MEWTEVSLDGWCKGGLGQQWDDGGGSATMCKSLGGVKTFVAYVDD